MKINTNEVRDSIVRFAKSKLYFIVLFTYCLLNMTELSFSQTIQQLNMLQKTVHSVLFINEADMRQKEPMIDVRNATAFSFKYEGKLFLACAKHSVERYCKNRDVVLFRVALNEDSTTYQRGILYYANSTADVALIQPIDFPGIKKIEYFSCSESISLSSSELPVLGELFLLGYPTYNTGETTSVFRSVDEEGNYYPIIKKGFVSGFEKSDASNNKYYVDAQLCKGFSGGPAYYLDTSGKIVIVGIITNTSVSNILDKNYQIIGDLYQTGSFSIITDIKHLISLIEGINSKE